MNSRKGSENKFQVIRNLKKDLRAASSTIANSCTHKNEDVAIFIGSTKSGKSTLINYLIGNKLLGVKDETLRTVRVEKADHPGYRGPEIGRGPSSETVIPTRSSRPEIDGESVNVDFLTDLLEHKILSETSLEISRPVAEFVRHLIRNDKQIGLFRRASVGRITRDIDAGVVQAIGTAKSIGRRILKIISPSVSDKSKVFLHEIRHDLISSGPLEELGSAVAEIIKDRFDDFEREIDSINFSRGSLSRRDDKLNCIQDQLKCLKKYIGILSNSDTSFFEIIKILRKIDPCLESAIDIEDVVDKKNTMEFIDRLLDLDNTQSIMCQFRSEMETVKSSASEVMLSLQTAMEAVEKDKIRRRLRREREEREEEERKREEREEEERERRRRERESQRKREEREEEERERRRRERESQSSGESEKGVFETVNDYLFNPSPILKYLPFKFP